MNDVEWNSIPSLRAEVERLRAELAEARTVRTAPPEPEQVKSTPVTKKPALKKKGWLA